MSHSPLLFYFNSKPSKQLLDICFSLTFYKTFHRTVDLVAVQYLKTPNSLFKISLKTIFIELQNYFQTQKTQISN